MLWVYRRLAQTTNANGFGTMSQITIVFVAPLISNHRGFRRFGSLLLLLLQPLEIRSHFQCGDRLYTSESDVYRRQILTYTDGPRAGRINL